MSSFHSSMHYQYSFQVPVRPAVKKILILTGAAFVVQILLDMTLAPHPDFGHPLFTTPVFGLSLSGLMHGWIWQPITYMLVHADLLHVGLNMLGLYMLGSEVERILGHNRFILFYILCGMAGGLCWVALGLVGGHGISVPVVGASGAVYGVLGAFGAMFPELKLRLLLPPITLKARTLAIAAGVLAFLMTFSLESGGRTAHLVHFIGFLAGFFYGLKVKKFADMGLEMPTLNVPAFLDLRARSKRSRFSVVSGGQENHPVTKADVDRVLEKLHKHGFQSLSVREREILAQSRDLFS